MSWHKLEFICPYCGIEPRILSASTDYDQILLSLYCKKCRRPLTMVYAFAGLRAYVDARQPNNILMLDKQFLREMKIKPDLEEK